VPYVTAHNIENDVSLLWVNSADTWSEVIPMNNQTMTSFISESG
jgi:hypothetical protein